MALVGGLVTSACGGSNDDNGNRRDDDARAAESTTTTTDPAEAERPRVVEARQVAGEAETVALGPPAPNPALPAITQTRTGPAQDQVFATAELMARNGTVWRYPTDSQRRLDVRSVTFPDGPGGAVAWLETCDVDDSDYTVDDGHPWVNEPRGVIRDYPVRATLRTETMRRVDGTWRLEETTPHPPTDNATQCPDEAPHPATTTNPEPAPVPAYDPAEEPF